MKRLGVVLLLVLMMGCETVTPLPVTPTPALTATFTPVDPTLVPTQITPTLSSPSPSPSPSLTASPTASPVPASPTVTSTPFPPPSPTWTLVPPTFTPTPSPPCEQGPIILYFNANVEEADPGDRITLSWCSEGGTKAHLYHLLLSGQFGSFWEVPPTGTMDYEIPPEARNWEGFVLYVSDDLDRTARADLMVSLRCPDDWFFSPAPEECPSAPALITDGAEAQFEHGVMVWNRAEDRIYVLIDHGTWRTWMAREDTWEEGQPESDPSLVPPPGLYQPIRGIGKVWRETPGLREQLGWALGPEVGYTTAIQRTSRFKYNEFYIKAADGGVWHLRPEGSGWDYIP